MLNKSFKLSILAVSISTLAACFSGGSGNKPPVSQPTSVEGRAIDGPLSGATVTFVDCENKTVTTNTTGYFSFPEGCTSSALLVSGGIDTATDLPFEGTLSSPKLTATAGIVNNLVVTPITTLIHSLGGADKAAQIAASLGLTGNLLTLDPTKDQNLYAKTVAVQQLAEEIQQAIGALGTSYSSTELSALAFTAVAQALAAAPAGTTDALSNVDVITAALNNTLDAVKETLPEDQKNNLENIKANLAALIAPSIAAQVKSVEDAIKAITNFNASADNTALIKQQTKDAIAATKGSIATEKVIGLLGNLLVLDKAEVADLLAQIAQNLNSDTPDAASIKDALDKLAVIAQDNGIPFIVDESLVDSIVNAEDFYTNYLKIDGLNVTNTTYTPEQLVASLTTPITLLALDNLTIGVNAVGSYASTSQTVAAALKVAGTNTEAVTVKLDKVTLSFDTAGALNAAVINAGAKLKLDSQSKSATITIPADVNILDNGKLALNTTVLGSLLPTHLSTQLEALAPKGATNVTALIAPAGTTPVAYESSKGLAVVSKYTLGTSNGYGVTAKFNIAQ